MYCSLKFFVTLFALLNAAYARPAGETETTNSYPVTQGIVAIAAGSSDGVLATTNSPFSAGSPIATTKASFKSAKLPNGEVLATTNGPVFSTAVPSTTKILATSHVPVYTTAIPSTTGSLVASTTRNAKNVNLSNDAVIATTYSPVYSTGTPIATTRSNVKSIKLSNGEVLVTTNTQVFSTAVPSTTTPNWFTTRPPYFTTATLH